MPPRKPFLLRLNPALFESLQRWADDDLRSLNGQIEFLLRRSLTASGRIKPAVDDGRSNSDAAYQDDIVQEA